MCLPSFQVLKKHPYALALKTRATGRVKDDPSDHRWALVAQWTKVSHLHFLLPIY